MELFGTRTRPSMNRAGTQETAAARSNNTMRDTFAWAVVIHAMGIKKIGRSEMSNTMLHCAILSNLPSLLMAGWYHKNQAPAFRAGVWMFCTVSRILSCPPPKRGEANLYL